MKRQVNNTQMKTLLICHADDELNSKGLPMWLGSFSELCGIVYIKEEKGRFIERIRSELKRSGITGLINVFLFRIYYQFFLSKRDRKIQSSRLQSLTREYPNYRGDELKLVAQSPNTPEVVSFIESINPDIIIARCKTILKKDIFELANKGTFVMHPGICPEYRNSHGCFWALASNDLENVGMTLLKIDEGIDTGPVYAYFKVEFDEISETHITIQDRTVFDNLDAIKCKLQQIYDGGASALNTTGRKSKAWGQPWLSKYIKWKLSARRRKK